MADLIELDSEEGQKLWDECNEQAGSVYQPILKSIFGKEVGLGACGIQSAALLTSAAHLGQSYPLRTSISVEVTRDEIQHTEETLLAAPQTRSVIDAENLHNTGLALTDVFDVLTSHGYSADAFFASDRSLEMFRKDAIAALSKLDSSEGIIVNYHMPTLGQKGPWGHHSPLAAYHKDTDKFLILDVAKQTKECWATASNLYNAMRAVDAPSGKTRGYIVVHYNTL